MIAGPQAAGCAGAVSRRGNTEVFCHVTIAARRPRRAALFPCLYVRPSFFFYSRSATGRTVRKSNEYYFSSLICINDLNDTVLSVAKTRRRQKKNPVRKIRNRSVPESQSSKSFDKLCCARFPVRVTLLHVKHLLSTSTD